MDRDGSIAAVAAVTADQPGAAADSATRLTTLLMKPGDTHGRTAPPTAPPAAATRTNALAGRDAEAVWNCAPAEGHLKHRRNL